MRLLRSPILGSYLDDLKGLEGVEEEGYHFLGVVGGY